LTALASCALAAAAAAWLSFGTVGFASADGARIGLLPTSAAALLAVLFAAAFVVFFIRRGAPPSALTPLVLIALPWLPLRVPAAFLLWTGPLTALVWIAVGLLLVRGAPPRPAPHWHVALRPPVLAGLLALLIFGAAAWRAAPSMPSGDEPHYLVITQSLLLDGDLRIANNHRRGDYRSYHFGDLPPHVQRLGRDGQVYSIHAPGLPALVLPAFAAGGYRGVVVFLLLIASAGSALAWWLAWLTTRRSDAAWFGWAAVTLPATAVFHSFSVYPDAPGGVLALTGAWALLRADHERERKADRVAPWFWHGVALAALPWLHSRLAVIAGGIGALILLRLSTTRNPAAKAVAFLAVPAVSALLWVGYFIAIYGTPDPSAPYAAGEAGSIVWVPGGLGGLLFDQRFGLLPYAPVVASGVAGLAIMLWRPQTRRLGLELLFVIVPYLLTVTHFAMWWGGWSAPARFFVAVLPLFVVPAAVLWTAVSERRERTLVWGALALTAFATFTVVAVERGRLAFNVRDTPALWFAWLSRTSDLPQALPWWSREAVPAFYRDVAIWVVAAGAAILIARVLTSRLAPAGRHAWRVWLTCAVAAAAMAASTTVWAVRGVDGRQVAAAQLELLRAAAASPRVMALDLERATAISRSTVPRRVRIELARELSAPRAASRDTRPLFEVPSLPPGHYRVTPIADNPRGWIMIGIGRDQFALRTAPLPSPPFDLTFPVAVRGIVIRGDEDARQTVRGVLIEPMQVLPPVRPDGGTARTAVRYGSATVFFLDDRSFREPEAFWVGGARSSSLVFAPDPPQTSASVRVRNGPSANHVTVENAGERTELDFAPGEERQLTFGVDPARAAALVTVTVTGGFRPSDHEKGSRDDRFLGLWVKVE
jgi:hypothetical protein